MTRFRRTEADDRAGLRRRLLSLALLLGLLCLIPAPLAAASVSTAASNSFSVSFTVDGNPPTTSASASNADLTPYTFGSWTHQAVTVTLSADDAGGSGVAATYYTIDNGTQQTYSAPFVIGDEGTHAVTFWSVDQLANVEDKQTVQVMIDLTPPSITFNGNQGSYQLGDTVDITCTATDALSGIASTTCQNVDAPASSFPFGVNTLNAFATDNAGNVSQRSIVFNVQPPAPTPKASITATSNGSVRLWVFLVTNQLGYRPFGFMVYKDPNQQLILMRAVSLTVNGDVATVYGTADTADYTFVGFTMTLHSNDAHSTMRMQLSNGYDSGAQPIPFLHINIKP